MTFEELKESGYNCREDDNIDWGRIKEYQKLSDEEIDRRIEEQYMKDIEFSKKIKFG